MRKTEPTIYSLSGLHCGKCVARVTAALQPWAQEVHVSLKPMQVRLQGLSEGADFHALQVAVSSAGEYLLKEKMALSHIEHAQDATDSIANKSPLKMSWWATYYPLLLILSFILSASVIVQIGQHAGHGMELSALSGGETMRYFMAGFFIVFAFFKLLNIRAFADAYAGYDLLAARWHGWGYVYPFVELGLGIAYLAHWQPTFTHWVTIAVMGFSAIGVIRAVMSKSQIQCACLGTVFKLPMSTVTIVEDVGMVLMTATMLVYS
jgi:copper chaperone CopZ